MQNIFFCEWVYEIHSFIYKGLLSVSYGFDMRNKDGQDLACTPRCIKSLTNMCMKQGQK